MNPDTFTVEYLWIDRDSIPALLKMHPRRLLAYLAARDRADNKTQTIVWDQQALSARAGANSPRALDGALAAYQAAGLIEKVETRPGQPSKVTLPKVPHTRRVQIPLALIWPLSWASTPKGQPHPLRHGDDTAALVKALLVDAATGQWDTDGFTNRLAQPVKAKRAGVPLRTYQRHYATLCSFAEEPWLSIETTYRDDDGKDTDTVKVMWLAVPQMFSTPVPEHRGVGPSDDSDPTVFWREGSRRFSTGGSRRSGGRGHGVLADLYREHSPFSSFLSDHSFPPIPKPTTIAAADGNPTQLRGWEEEDKNSTTTRDGIAAITSSREEAAAHLDVLINKAGGSRRALDAHGWLLVVVANLLHHSDPTRRLRLTPSDARAVAAILHPLRDGGWDALALADALTRQTGDVDDPLAVLKHRLRRLHGTTPTATTAASDAYWMPRRLTAAEQAENDAFRRKAAARNASHFTRRTM
jgi:hypothetical protein